ncbi:hypothetical protein [Bacillus pseudomycoides]|nr:hypothetical protein [Bacillus pseudomycoides]PEN08631.1 hypothetical protein CN640_13440 [Bacillus pseudomycoides]PFZ93703.1 hypothetical protein COL70_08780 [Bacillus pseudomycoides]
MKYGIYLSGECVKVKDDIFSAYEDAVFYTRESGIPHEVKIINEKKN